MPYTLKFLIPTLLGLAAAGINWVMLSSKAGTVQFVTVNKDIETGRPLRREDLSLVELPLQFASLSSSAIPFSEVGLLEGQIAQRALTSGDLLFYRDTTIHGLELDIRKGEEIFTVDISEVAVVPRLMRIGYLISFRIPSQAGGELAEPAWVGPFRLVAANSIISNDEGESRQTPATVTVAYKTDENGRARTETTALQKFCDRQALTDIRLLGVRITPTAN